MLERAAGCLENAGRRFFRDSNGMIRGPKSFNSGPGKNTIASVECLRWLLISLRTKLTRSSSALGGKSSSGAITNDARSPFLEFLYPPHAQEVVTSSLLRTPKRLPPRRKKKSIPSLSRNYATQAIGLRQSARECKPEDETVEESNETSETRKILDSLLADAELGQYDEAWALYVALGHPADMASALLAYLSSSTHAVDCRRAKRLVEEIAVDSRSAEDYLNLARSYHSNGLATEMISTCKEAISKHRGHNCWAFTLANLFAAANWGALQDIWQSKPTSSENQLWSLLVPHISAPDFAQHLLALSTYLDEGDADVSLRGLASFFLAHVFRSRDVVENISTENLLLLLRKYHALGILKPHNYFDLIETFQSSDIRSTFVKSIIVYRNFRWQLQGEVPPSKILGKLLERLATLEITTGVQYLLDEFTQFYRKPSVYAYRSALIAFSRAGDVQNVTRVFDRYLLDHGKPLSRKLVTPVLYVHARAGDVKSTLRQFKRISEEFDLTPNTICWNIVLTAYGRSDDFNGAFETFKTMLEHKVEPNSHTFGTLMGLSANKGDIETVRQLLVLAKKKRVQITTPLLDTVVEAYCNNHRLDLAESVAETCVGLRVKGSRLRMWNLLLWNHAFRMDLDAISRIRSRMDAIGLAPDEMTYAALMLSLVLINQTDSARRILRTLHRSRRIFASEFHYTIILYGYVKARNRDMVHIVFREIKKRFSKPGLSSHLLVLRSQLHRDLQLVQHGGGEADAAQVRLEYAEKFLVETLVEFDRTKLASKEPLPGAGRRSPSRAFPVVYFEHIINAYGTRGVSKKARELFDEYLRSRTTPDDPEAVEDIAPIRLIAALMLAHLKGGEYQKVEECWNMVLPRAKTLASRPNVDEWLSIKSPPTTDATEPGPPQPSLPISVRSEPEGGLQSATSEATWPRTSVLPSYRFCISRPLSLYMRSLAYRNEAWKLPQLALDIKKAGFSLTTFNWSTMVQMLASSDRPSDQAEAFTIFETKFMPNFPGWKNLRRGYGLKPDGVPDSIDLMEKPNRSKPPHVLGKEGRRYWSKIQPDFLQPTYISMVYLASSLLRFRERSLYDGSAEVKALYREAPRTIKAIARMPVLRDKFQGVLLRRRQERSDKQNDGSHHFVWTGGILGVGGRRRAIPQPEKEENDQHEEEDLEEDEDANETEEAEETEEIEKTEEEKEAEALALQYAHVRPDPDNTTEVAEDSFIIEETLSSGNTSELPEKTIDSQDEYDIEAESLLEARRIADGVIDEMLDIEQRDSSDENDQHDDNTPPLEEEHHSDQDHSDTDNQLPEGEMHEKSDEDSR
ncbi:putative translation regulator (Cya5) [Aspergillus melleus]|uniref:putative translation regulator (Cya5) n=1 Tax=Aspergillus melleus TaxID=138277 RepID=UPI001E8DB32C|nr:uncharacterized protein LDX57_005773 [Aspergillus melleus]KAH8428068.1 hypothetical protein LDX57_005773 [Aspergillus melleus]